MTEENSFTEAPETVAQVATPVASAPTEKMLPQSQVDQIVGKAKHEAAEKVRREYQSQQTQSADLYSSTMQNSAPTGMGNVSPDSLRSMIAEETKRVQQELRQEAQGEQQRQEGERIAQKFLSQMQSGASEFDDFSDAIADMPFEKMPQIVHAASELDNTAAVMRHLALNPMKLSAVMGLAKDGMTKQVAKFMYDVSASIKSNDKSRSISAPNDPLSQIKSSPISTDSGPRTVSDFRKMLRKK